MTEAVDALIREGRQALADLDWQTARSCFEQARQAAESAEILDGLGQALYWQGHYREALPLRERAYGLYHERGDRRSAAIVAIRLAALHGMIFGNAAAVSGWVGHARRMLDGDEDCAEQGWVELFLAVIAEDPYERREASRRAMHLGRRFGDPALEFDALGYAGKALIELGEVSEGMALIDQAVAAVTSGLVTEPWATGEIYCTLFHACEMTGDVRRADGWLDAVDGYVEHTGELPISGICRMHYGGVLTTAGRWEEAERELLTALAIYDGTYRGTRFEPLIRLADLRVRQDRPEEALRLLDGHERRPDAALPLARVHLARGDLEHAATVTGRYLERRGRGVLSAPMLALLVEVEIARGRLAAAADCVGELEALAAAAGQPSVHGFAALSHARVAVCRNENTARTWFDDAIESFVDAGLPYERATAHLELARLLTADQPEVASVEARAALSVFEKVGAVRGADESASILRSLGERRGRSWPKSTATLTKRQIEVLGLLAEGLSNANIAERLYISVRTVEHHVSNILNELGLSSRAEATAYAVRHRVADGLRIRPGRT